MAERTRREPRYPVLLPAALTVAGRVFDCVTRDVSFEGVFLALGAPGSMALAPQAQGRSQARARSGNAAPAALKLGQIARLTLSVPNIQTPLDVTGVVVHTVRRKRSSGAGLRFYGMAGPARALWDRFIGRLRDEFPLMTGRAVGLARAEHFEPKLYRSAHQVAVLRVYVSSVADLYAMAEPEVENMFVLTDEPVRVGDEVGLQMVHPDSEEIFEVAAFVRRIVDQHGVRGLDVEFLDLDADRRARLSEFIDDGLEVLFDEEILVDDTKTEDADDRATPTIDKSR